MSAIGRAQAVIEFKMDGTIVTANENFLAPWATRWPRSRASITACSSSRPSATARTIASSGPASAAANSRPREYKRIGKGGKEVWIQASYNPILDENGKPFKVVKFATDVTAQKLQERRPRRPDRRDRQGAGGDRVQHGRHDHHRQREFPRRDRLFARTRSRASTTACSSSRPSATAPAYREFWAALDRGEYQAAEYKRIGKGGKEVWIQASYNPILDLNGKPFKVVKYATDITRQVLVRMGNERVRGMMESVAAGAEELNASVREISEAMTKSRETATSAVEQVDAADAQAQRLTEAAQAMGGIVEMIDNITGQINLLALNATIESARAGEAGRGFAVVASEVKSLANQAKQATDKIGQEIGSLNGISGDVVSALTRSSRRSKASANTSLRPPPPSRSRARSRTRCRPACSAPPRKLLRWRQRA